LIEQHEPTSPDAVIQQQQKQKAQQIKRILIGLCLLLLVALIVVVLSITPSEQASTDVSPATVESSFNVAEQEAAREAFRQALSEYESQLAPILATPSLREWDPATAASLDAESDKALRLFANSAFIQALGSINSVKTQGQAFVDSWQAAFADALAQAKQFYAQDQIQQARLALQQAKAIMPNQTQTQQLEAQLRAYDSVAVLLAALDVAKVENNLAKQVSLMQQILQADPTRTQLQGALREAQEKLKEQRLSAALLKVEDALAQNDLAGAQDGLQIARTIDPTAKGIESFNAQIQQRLSEQDLSAVLANLEQLTRTDNWAQASQNATAALTRFTGNAALKQVQSEAQAVLAQQQSLRRFTSRPERVADENIRNAAKNALQQSILYLSKSPTLAAQAQTLAALIDKYSAQIPVTIESDGNTHLIVVGVGIVGEVEQHTIELGPGQYVLEGKREGYRSKRLPFEVKANSPLTLRLIVDETIE
jgi:hypothetical protein